MPGPPSAEVLNAKPREAGRGPGQPLAREGHCGMRPPGTGTAGRAGGERGREGRADGRERGWRLSRGLGQGTQSRGVFPIAGSYRRGLPSWLHPQLPAHEPDPQNSGDLPDIAAVSVGRYLLLQASGATRFVLPNCPL